ncbi:cytochrome P450 oxidoreductase [Pseudohyphozyma bogoriensis]|nr:cytochrome P450 oxidoreductase [Pseudohyphozyma bogoriensis]
MNFHLHRSFSEPIPGSGATVHNVGLASARQAREPDELEKEALREVQPYLKQFLSEWMKNVKDTSFHSAEEDQGVMVLRLNTVGGTITSSELRRLPEEDDIVVPGMRHGVAIRQEVLSHDRKAGVLAWIDFTIPEKDTTEYIIVGVKFLGQARKMDHPHAPPTSSPLKNEVLEVGKRPRGATTPRVLNHMRQAQSY